MPVLHQLEQDAVAILGPDELVEILQAFIDLDFAPTAFERILKLRRRNSRDFASEVRRHEIAVGVSRRIAVSHDRQELLPPLVLCSAWQNRRLLIPELEG